MIWTEDLKGSQTQSLKATHEEILKTSERKEEKVGNLTVMMIMMMKMMMMIPTIMSFIRTQKGKIKVRREIILNPQATKENRRKGEISSQMKMVMK
ncbi:MAG: hypothetical protein IPK55_11270 [Streptococcus sp.]|nr:hypothetical protein [Streptococcus sp.]